MKCFVYTKNGNKKVAIIQDVVTVSQPNRNEIVFTTRTGTVFTFNTKEFKTTSYQN